jgi:hypothetical protein
MQTRLKQQREQELKE